MPAGEGEGVLECLHRAVRLARHHLLLRHRHHRLELLAGPAGEEDVRAHRGGHAGQNAAPGMGDARQEEEQEAGGAGRE